ncbi:MAG: trypsin-like serine protease [Phycisphaerales bacterium]|nr:trypsin-like serine protease [Phycisphaerales bacterium]
MDTTHRRGRRAGRFGLTGILTTLSVVATIAPITAAAGDDRSGQPRPTAQVRSLPAVENAARVASDAIDYDAVRVEDGAREQQGLPPRFALPRDVRISPATHGQWDRTGNEWVWRLAIESPNAKSINLGFTRYRMTNSGTLMVYAADYGHVLRPFTAKDNAAHHELWTPPILSKSIVVEVTLPADERDKLDLELGRINVGYRGFGTGDTFSGACNVDVVCPEGDDWRNEIPSVAVISTGGGTFCTGFMVNNVRQDLTPYFMTANHCGINAGNAASLVTFWNYETSTCGGAPNGVLNEFQTGSFFRATSSTSDFTLVELDEAPNPAHMVTFSGWDATGADAASAVAIHHPNTDEKRISFEFQPTTTTTYLQNPVPGDGTHVRIEDWDVGTTEPGSSGSPLFNQDHHIIGQLHGGFASCSSQTSDWYGKFSRSWTGGGTSATQLKFWLDPDNTGTLVIDTISGAGLQVSPAGDVTHVGAVGGPFTPGSVAYTLTNPSPDDVDYSVSIGIGDAPLLLNGGAGPVTGTLTALGGSAMVTVSLNSPGSLASGLYSTPVAFDDVTNTRTTTVTHNIEVGATDFTTTPAAAFISGGPLGGPFTGTLNYTLTSTKPTPVDITVTASDPWISLNGVAGPLNLTLTGTGDSTIVTVGISAVANGLSAGLYNGSVGFDNTSGGTGDASRDVALDVGRLVYAPLDVPQPISDNTNITSTVTVNDAFCVGDVDLDVDITHTYIGDLIVELESPGGVTVRLHNRTGGTTENIITRYDDDGDGTIPDGPGQLADFDFGGSQGVWTLTVSDNAGSDTGALNNWSLRLAPNGVTCPPIAFDATVSVSETLQSLVTLDGESVQSLPLAFIIASLPGQGDLIDSMGGMISTVPYTLIGMGDTVIYDPDDGYAGPDAFQFRVNDGQDSAIADVDLDVGGPQLVYQYPMDTNPGWSTQGSWAYGPPAGLSGDPSSGATGLYVYGYNLNGDYTSGMTVQNLTSTPIDCSNISQVAVKFQRWLGVEQATYDHARFQVSNNGTVWTTVWENPTGTGLSVDESAWSLQSYNIGALADHQPSVQLRWTMGTTDGSVVFHGWNIDDVEIWGAPDEVDCDNNGLADLAEIAAGDHDDCQPNAVPDECDIVAGAPDNNDNGVPDACESFCTIPVECDDDDVCTRDECLSSACVNSPALYSDVNHDGAVDIFDILCVLDGFAGEFSICALADLDLAPCPAGDEAVDIFDILGCLDAFAGDPGCCGP